MSGSNSIVGGRVKNLEFNDGEIHQQDLNATQSVKITKGTTVVGTIRAPIVTLMNGAKVVGDIYADVYIVIIDSVHEGTHYKFSS